MPIKASSVPVKWYLQLENGIVYKVRVFEYANSKARIVDDNMPSAHYYWVWLGDLGDTADEAVQKRGSEIARHRIEICKKIDALTVERDVLDHLIEKHKVPHA